MTDAGGLWSVQVDSAHKLVEAAAVSTLALPLHRSETSSDLGLDEPNDHHGSMKRGWKLLRGRYEEDILNWKN